MWGNFVPIGSFSHDTIDFDDHGVQFRYVISVMVYPIIAIVLIGLFSASFEYVLTS